MVISTNHKKSLRKLTAENLELKTQLASARQWSNAWKKGCFSQRQANAEMIIKSADVLEAILNLVGAVTDEVWHSMEVSTVQNADRIFEVHITDEDRLQMVLQGLKGIETYVKQGVAGCAKEFNIEEDAEGERFAAPRMEELQEHGMFSALFSIAVSFSTRSSPCAQQELKSHRHCSQIRLSQARRQCRHRRQREDFPKKKAAGPGAMLQALRPFSLPGRNTHPNERDNAP